MSQADIRQVSADPDGAVEDLRSLGDVVRYACTRFQATRIAFGQGTANAEEEAAWLVSWALHLAPDAAQTHTHARLTRRERAQIVSLIERRCQERLPLAYLTGEAWLRGRRFACDARALIPRSLIAEALEESLPDWLGTLDLPEGWPRTVLDLCTGGGSLAVMAAQCFETARVTAADLSASALELAAKNVAEYGLDERIELARGDLFAAIGSERFDLVVCNPPYVNAGSMSALPPEFLAEPQAALAGGVDGMDLIRRILRDAGEHLNPGGQLLLEIGHEASHFENAFAGLRCVYLPVTAGDEMLVLISREQLADAAQALLR
ncbi:MAG: 50S ribosomal protein L3 N(5)-glutamine methyltransferase [Burkholderiaceae bacterium]|nr:50S ribosomal protein L3 N(5)-glutamine methyltransferase [Burkholderiaceae bacterium]